MAPFNTRALLPLSHPATPDGDELWGLGISVFGPAVEYAGKGLSYFDVQMRSWFEDHMYDLAPDRGYDELPIGYDVPPELRRLIEVS